MNTTVAHRHLSELRAEMARAGVSQKDLAPVLGVSIAAVNRRMLGQVSFRLDELSLIAKHLGVQMDQIIGNEEQIPPALATGTRSPASKRVAS